MQYRFRGMGLIDVIVGSALVLIIFLALMGILRASILLSGLDKANAGADSLAASQMEYLRGLSYDNLGTIGGIPAGMVPQTKSVTTDNTTYTITNYIQYIDDHADGLGANDTNGIITDYKIGKVTVSYFAGGKARKVALISTFAPPGIETTNGGGTLQLNVVNATGAAVPGATIHIINVNTSPTVDLSTFSNASGIAYLPGAATSTSYQIVVTKNGYSSAQTYARTTNNQNPSPGYLTVVKNQTTTGTFAIDLLASLALYTYSPPAPGTFSDTFTNESLLAATTSVAAINGALQIVSTSTTSLSGSALSVPVSPSLLRSWGALSAGITAASGSSVLVHVYDGSGTLVPDSVLSGNAAGFTTFPVSLSDISTTTYPTLAIGANITTTKISIVPKILNWSLGYITGPAPLPNVPFTLIGTKTIGSTGTGVALYKNTISSSTGSPGKQTLSLEWDAYSLSAITGYDIENACPAPPYTLSPGSNNVATLTLVPKTNNRLYTVVQDANGNSVSGATVVLSSAAASYTQTAITSPCGGVYFGGLTSEKDYAIAISKSGYTTTRFTGISISGQTLYAASFP